MATDVQSPREIVGAALARDPGAIVDASIDMLERLANTLIGIIGEPGFETLLFRSVHRVNLDFPWLAFDPRAAPDDPEFMVLRRCFDEADLAQATAASTLLFHTLIDILTLLLGAHLTTLILHEALGEAGARRAGGGADQRVAIGRLATGIPGFDELMGGGIAEFSFNVITGASGSGKTTLAHQIMFSLAAPACRALFFTFMGEPPLKALRYQQQFSFFDFDKLGNSVRFVNLASDMANGDFDRVVARIIDEVQEFAPRLVFVDSFSSVIPAGAAGAPAAADLQSFIQQLAMQMASWEATTFLIGESLQADNESEPVSTVADGILCLSQLVRGDTMVRKMQVVKMRGGAQKPGAHTFRIDGRGVRVFPRALPLGAAPLLPGKERLRLGVPELDDMLGGGVPAGYALLLVGPSGSGKSVLAAEFLAEGARAGETGVVAAFEGGAGALAGKLSQLIADGAATFIDTGASDLSIDETLDALATAVEATHARRVVIDSLSGFALALAPAGRDDFAASLHHLLAVLAGMGVTVLMTAEPEQEQAIGGFGACDAAFLAGAVVMQRFVELAGQLRRVISVVKVRGSEHSKDIRFFDIEGGRPRIGERLPA